MENAVQKKQVPAKGKNAKAEAASARTQYLSFLLDGEIYAFSVMNIKEIIEYASVTRVPMAPGFIRGVTNLRGNVVPVIDLAARLGKGPRKVDKRTCIILLEAQSEDDKIDIGVVIDAINEVISIGGDEIEPSPSFGAGIRADFISGMGRVNGKFVVLLNSEKVLSVEELSMLGEEYGEHQMLAEVRSRQAAIASKNNGSGEKA